MSRNKQVKMKPYCLIFCMAVAVIMLPACRSLVDVKKGMALKIPDEKLDEITTFDHEKMTSSDSGNKQEPDEEPAEINLSIEECRVLALKYNLQLKVDLLDPTISKENVIREDAKYEAIILANARQNKTDTPVSTRLDGSQTETGSINFGVRYPLITGGTITADLPLNRSKTNNAFSTLNPAFTTDFTFSISQPLLKNSGIRNNMHSIRLAEYQHQSSQARTKLQVMTVIAAVDRLYWQLYAARRELIVREQEYELARKQLETAKNKVANKVLAGIEVVRAEAGMASKLESIILSEVNVRERQRDLKLIINKPEMSIGSKTIIKQATEPNPIQFQFDPEKIIKAAMSQRMDLLEVEIQLAMNQSSIHYARNQVLPLFNLTYRYNANGLGGSAGKAFDVLRDKNFEDHMVGFQFELPIGNQAAKSQLRESIFRRIRTLATKAQRKMAIKQEIYNAVDRLEADWQRILAARQSTILSARTLAGEERQYELQLRTSTDVLEAQTNLANAQSSEINAITAYQISQIDLAVATGTLLGASKVVWEPLRPVIDVK